MSTSLLPTNTSLAVHCDKPTPRSVQPAVLHALGRRSPFDGSPNGWIARDTASPGHDRDAPIVSHPAVKICPSHSVGRRAFTRHGVTAEIVQANSLERIEFRFRAPMHLLVVCERGVRRDGDTFVEGLPRSTLRDLSRKLTFVPAGYEYREWHVPRVLTRLTYFYFDPERLSVQDEPALADTPLAPRLFFEDEALSCTARKLQKLIESPESNTQRYFEALAVVLACELMGVGGAAAGNQIAGPRRPGGLAAADRHRLHRGEPGRADPARHAGGPCAAEQSLFLQSLQAIVPSSTAPLSQQPSHRACQDAAGKTDLVGHRDRSGAGL